MTPFNIVLAFFLTINLLFMPVIIQKAVKKFKSIIDPKNNSSYCVIATWILYLIMIQAGFVFVQNSVFLIRIFEEPETNFFIKDGSKAILDQVAGVTVPLIYYQADLIQIF